VRQSDKATVNMRGTGTRVRPRDMPVGRHRRSNATNESGHKALGVI